MREVATGNNNMPRASAVEFFPIGTTIYILTEGGRKIENIAMNKNVSAAIHTQFTGWDSIKGVQITGTAEIGKSGSRIFEEGEEARHRARAHILTSWVVLKNRPMSSTSSRHDRLLFDTGQGQDIFGPNTLK